MTTALCMLCVYMLSCMCCVLFNCFVYSNVIVLLYNAD